jgi:hypothetical protein
MRLTRCLALVALVAGQSAYAATVLESDVTHAGNRYAVNFAFRVQAEAARVRELLLDYERRPLADSVQELQLIELRADGSRRVRVVLRVCVLVFCQTMIKYAEMQVTPDGSVLSEGDPTGSDFELIRERWTLTPDGDGTRVRYQSELIPRFFIPPLIGPWLLKTRLLGELETTAERIERYAQEPYAVPSP